MTYPQRIARLIASLFLTTALDNIRRLHPHIIRIRHTSAASSAYILRLRRLRRLLRLLRGTRIRRVACHVTTCHVTTCTGTLPSTQ